MGSVVLPVLALFSFSSGDDNVVCGLNLNLLNFQICYSQFKNVSTCLFVCLCVLLNLFELCFQENLHPFIQILPNSVASRCDHLRSGQRILEV